MKTTTLASVLLLLTIGIASADSPCGEYGPGDVNGDGVVNVLDAILVLRYLRGLEEFTPQQIRAADVDCNGEVEEDDAWLIVQFAVGRIDEFPCNPCVQEPIVTTDEATNITSTSATLWGRIIDDGGEECDYQFRYKMDGGEWRYLEWSGIATTDQGFGQTISDLVANSKYYFSVRAENSAGRTAWSIEREFRTASDGNCNTIAIGTGTSEWGYPMHTSWHDSRTQVIYLAGEIGNSGPITSLALDVVTPPGQTMNNWTIRMKHTTLSEYDDYFLEANDWTIVYQHDETIESPGWSTFEFDRPFEYNGTENLLVDFSHNNDSFTENGECRASRPGGVRSVYDFSDSKRRDPLDWVGSFLVPGSDYVPNVKLTIGDCRKPSQCGFSDDFEDSIFDPIWEVQQGELAIEEINGEIRFRGTTIRGDWDHGSKFETITFPEGDFEVEVDFRIPTFSGSGFRLVSLNAHSSGWNQTVSIFYSAENFYRVMSHNPRQFSNWLPLFGDEATSFHRMKLTYDSAMETFRGYVDGIFVGSLKAKMSGRVSFYFFPTTEKARVSVDARFDNFSLRVGPEPCPSQFRLLGGTGGDGPNPYSIVELQTDPVTEIPICPDSRYNPALDVSPEGALYGASSELRKIVNLSDGSCNVITLGPIDSNTRTYILMRSIAFHPDGTLYGVATGDGDLYRIDTTTAFATKVCQISEFVWGIDFSPNGTLYGASGSLYTLDPTTCQVTLVGPLPASINDIDFAPDGFIYGVDYDTNMLYKIDPLDGSVAQQYGPYETTLWGVASQVTTIPGLVQNSVSDGANALFNINDPSGRLDTILDLEASILEEQALREERQAVIESIK